MQKILPPTYLLIYLAVGVALHLLLPVVQVLHPPLTYAGIIFVVFGIGINIWADGLFKKNATTVKPLDRPTALVTGGPFRISRHPMYLGFVALLFGVALVLGSLTAFLAPAAMLITMEVYFIPHEESNMAETFGDVYQDYKNQVRRWV